LDDVESFCTAYCNKLLLDFLQDLLQPTPTTQVAVTFSIEVFHIYTQKRPRNPLRGAPRGKMFGHGHEDRDFKFSPPFVP
jgi:hypothetical protein